MNDFQMGDEFRGKAYDQGLDLAYDHNKFDKYWVLDLNQGTIWTTRENIGKLYKLACEIFDRNYGEHVAIRQLVCRRVDLDNDRVYWERPYYTNKDKYPDKWISIAEFLELEK